MDDLLNNLKGKKLIGLEFVADDSVRFDFGSSSLIFYQWPTISINEKEVSDDDPGYRGLISGLANNTVVSIKLDEGTSLEIKFNSMRVYLALADDEESFYFKTADGNWMVG